MKNKLVFFGSDDFSLTVLESLRRAGYDIAAVVAQPDKPAGRLRSLTAPPAAGYAREHGLKLLQPVKLREIAAELASLSADAAVVASYGRLIPESLLELYGRKFINVHSSLLPKYRGAAPIEYPILNGEPETGVTIMQVASEMDAGDIIAQIKLPLDDTETRPYLYQKLAQAGARLLVEVLPDVINGTAQYIPQDHSEATFTAKITKESGRIDWSRPASELERQVRAYLGWPGSAAELAGAKVTITATKAIDGQGKPGTAFRHGKELAVYCGEGALLVERLKPAGKREMTGREFLAGHQSIT